MPGPFERPHLRIDGRIRRAEYTPPSSRGGGDRIPRNRGDHAVKLRSELDRSYEAFEARRIRDERLPNPDGVFLEVELRRGTPVETLDRKGPKIKAGPAKLDANDERRIGLFVPDDAREKLSDMLLNYETGDLTARGKAPLEGTFEPINEISAATLETFWTDDPDTLPDVGENFWWEVWVLNDSVELVQNMANELELSVSNADQWLHFAEHSVMQILGTRENIELIVFNGPSVVELRKAGDNPRVYIDEFDVADQTAAIEELSERIEWPDRDLPTVCLLDTGVARAHPLIEPALDEDDLLTVEAAWGVGDDLEFPHGTPMAGLSLYGDLVPLLSSTSPISLQHRLESVKMLPPDGFEATPEKAYGSVTQRAVALAEVNKPDRKRVFSLTITGDRNGYRPTGWSSAIDQLAVGRDITGDESPRRLFLIAAGNAPNPINTAEAQDANAIPIEDPAQAWNALTVGGYTDKINIDEPNLPGFTPVAGAGDISPYTRTSYLWTQGKSPYKPDIVMEAGNRALSPQQTEIYCVDSLALLSTSTGGDNHQLEASRATSAATAQAARLTARVMVDHPELWPETIRALTVHSARWTSVMETAFTNAGGKTARYPLLRRYGHGVPNYERATASAIDSVALVAEQTIQPFTETGSLNECHYFDLPWPRQALENLGNTEVRLKLTLSWFVEPNPGSSASFNPARYQSFGLRFDLRRPGESVQNFEMRNNKIAREQYRTAYRSVGDDNYWKFGPNAQSAGSLFSDEWVGPAINLLERDQICIRPVGGWWKSSASKEIRSSKARYALVVTLETPETSIDLYTPIQTEILNPVVIQI